MHVQLCGGQIASPPVRRPVRFVWSGGWCRAAILLAVAWLAGAAAGSEPAIRHRFIAMDEGSRQLLLVDEQNPAADWSVPCQGRDLQLIGGNAVLTNLEGPQSGYAEYDLTSGRQLRLVPLSFGTIRSVRRLSDGRTLAAGDNLAGRQGITVIELDRDNQLLRTTALAGHKDVRLMRRTAGDTFLVGSGRHVHELAWDDRLIQSRPLPIGKWFGGYMALPGADGRLLVAAGYHGAILELAADGAVLRTFGGPEVADAARIRPHFAGGFQQLANGHIVASNWQGHGGGHGRDGVQLLEYGPDGKVCWQWQDPRPTPRASSIHMVIVLDGLDTARLHDDSTGILQPVPAAAAPAGR